MNDFPRLFSVPRTLSVAGAALPQFQGHVLLTPVRLQGTETLGALDCYTLDLKTPDGATFGAGPATEVDLDALMGTEVTVTVQLEGNGLLSEGDVNLGAGEREITGVVTEAHILREEGRSVVYRLVLRPWLWLADQNRDCRIFQNMDVVAITDAVLAGYAYPVEKKLIEHYPVRDYQRQHWESDFHFLSRLWQEFGIYYWVSHSEGHHRLVLCDSIGAHQSHGEAYRSIRYQSPERPRLEGEYIHALSVTHALTSGVVTHTDYDYTRPRADLTTQHEAPRDTAHHTAEIYQWGDHSQPMAGTGGLSGQANVPLDEGRMLARVQAQALRSQGVRAYGEGRLRGLVTGNTFTLTQYPQSKANQDWLVVSSTLDITEVGEESGVGQHYSVLSRFELQPVREIFRNLRTATKPRTTGPEPAKVVGPTEAEIWTDAYGRVKVQFPWDRQGQNNEASSCWVRVSAPWQGGAFGGTQIPRIGQEVLVDHINGDPDLPVVTGRVVNAFNLPAWQLPQNQALSGFRSRELGGGRANHLVMDDTEGHIQTQLSSDEGLSQLSLGDITRIPGNPGRQEARGKGFELRTDHKGALRAGEGLLITTEQRDKGREHVTDMAETTARLDAAHTQADQFHQLAAQHDAVANPAALTDITSVLDEQHKDVQGSGAAQEGYFPEFTRPHLILNSPAGIQATTAGSIQLSPGDHLAVTTGGHLGLNIAKSLFAHVLQGLSIFVHKLDLRLTAAQGKLQLTAQHNDVEITAQQQVQIHSTTSVIELKAKDAIRLYAGGSMLEINSKGITGYTPGLFLVHAADHQTLGPQNKPVTFPGMPQADFCPRCFAIAAQRGGAIVKA